MKVFGSTLSVALALGAVLLAAQAVTPARAALGDTVATVGSDLARMKGQLRVQPGPGYSVQQITTADGTVVREYVSPAGVVFGVTWRGPVVPNLRQLLGSYFPQFVTAAKSRALGHNRVQVRQPGLVVEASGHMRAYFGKAYVPGLLPANVSPSDIQ